MRTSVHNFPAILGGGRPNVVTETNVEIAPLEDWEPTAFTDRNEKNFFSDLD
jgi:hypothetical protein